MSQETTGYSNFPYLDTELRTKPGLRMVGTFGIRSLYEGCTGVHTQMKQGVRSMYEGHTGVRTHR